MLYDGILVIHEDLDQIDDLDLEEMDINWQIAMTAIKIKKFYKKTGRRPRVDGKMHVAFDKRKVECFNCHNTGHFARECKFKGSKEGSRQEASRGQINWVEQTTDEELNHALMAFTVNNEVSMCSKLCLDSYNALQAKVGWENGYRRIGMKAVKDKDALQKIVDSWFTSSKNLWKLVDCGMSSTVKIGLGYGIKSNAEVLGYEEEMSRVMGSLEMCLMQIPLIYSILSIQDSDGEKGTDILHSVNDDPYHLIPSIVRSSNTDCSIPFNRYAFEEVNTGNTEAISPSADHEEVFSDADDDEMPEIRIYDKSSEGKLSEALEDGDWVEAMQEDLNKKDERGVVVRNKARLVAQGHRQEEGIDYIECFSVLALWMKEVLCLTTPGFVDPDPIAMVYKGIPLDLEAFLTVIWLVPTDRKSTKYCDKHNQVGFLRKPDESAGFAEIVDFLRGFNLRYALTTNPTIYDSLVKQCWQSATANTKTDGSLEINATIDTIRYTISEASIRDSLQLEDATGITMLPNDDLFEGMGQIGYPTDGTFTFWKSFFTPQWRYLVHHLLHCISSKSGGWDQFGSNIATALICLSTGRVYNFSKLIFDGMVANLKSKTKFLMYPRFLQMILNIQTENKHLYLAVSLTKKIFGNMKRGFRGAPRPLLPSMLLVATNPNAGQEHAAVAQTQPSSSTPQVPSPPSTPTPPLILTPTPTPSLIHIPTPTPPPIPTPTPIPDTEPTPFEHISEEPSPVHQPSSPPQEQAQGKMAMDDLLQAVPELISRIDSLETDLKQTKLTMGNAIVKLVKKVKKLEGTSENEEIEITATIDGKVKTITEASIRRHLKLEDSDGIPTLPNAKIFEQLALMGYASDSDKLTFQKGHFLPQWRFLIHTILYCLSPKKTAWEQFSSNIATAIICLATNRTFNISKKIFEGMLKNLDSRSKFLMYPRFIQIFLNKHKRHLLPHKRTYVAPTLTQKLFNNMRRVSKGYSGVNIPLFPTMLTSPESSPFRITSSPSLSPQTHSSTSQQPPTPPFMQTIHDAEEPATMPHDSFQPRVQSLGSDEGNEGTSWIQEDAKTQGRTNADTKILLDQEEPTKLVEDLGSGEKGEKEISTAEVPISTASEIPVVSTAIPKRQVYIRRGAEKRKDKGKAIMEDDESPQKKTKKQLEQERLGHEEAIRLQE
ncbi:putative ribonuclease H-like domain-containing protein [Tanacetum coccineum]